MARTREEIIEHLAYKYNLSVEEVEEIVNHQFKYIEKIMKDGKFETIRLPYFGKFSVKQKRVEYINKNKNEDTI